MENIKKFVFSLKSVQLIYVLYQHKTEQIKT
jgi:hypothetical protein